MEEIRIKLNEEAVRLGKILYDPRGCNKDLVRGKIQGIIFSLKLLPVNPVKSVVLDPVSKSLPTDDEIEDRIDETKSNWGDYGAGLEDGTRQGIDWVMKIIKT